MRTRRIRTRGGDEIRLFEYELPGDWHVLVGRNDAANDYLSVKLARANDWWFHVRGMPGSHVVLRVSGGEDPGRDILESAAAIAAHHSKARNGGKTSVVCTRAKNVSKRGGAKPGTVTVRKERILKVYPGTPD